MIPNFSVERIFPSQEQGHMVLFVHAGAGVGQMGTGALCGGMWYLKADTDVEEGQQH